MLLWRVLRSLSLVLLIAASGCQKTAWTKVVSTDGSATTGELVESRPDAIVVRTQDGKQVTILRSRIRSIGTPTAADVAAASDTAVPAPAASAPAAAVTPAPPPAQTSASNVSPVPAAAAPIAPGQIARSSPRSPHAGSTAQAVARDGSEPAVAPPQPAPPPTSASSTPPGAEPPSASRAAMVLAARLDTALASDDSEVDDDVEAILLNPLLVDGRQIVAAGAIVNGTVVESGKKGEGRPELAVRFTAIVRGDDDNIPIQASVLRWSGAVQQVAAGEAQSGSFIGKIKKGLGMNKSGTVTVVRQARVARGTPIDITLEAPLSPR